MAILLRLAATIWRLTPYALGLIVCTKLLLWYLTWFVVARLVLAVATVWVAGWLVARLRAADASRQARRRYVGGVIAPVAETPGSIVWAVYLAGLLPTLTIPHGISYTVTHRPAVLSTIDLMLSTLVLAWLVLYIDTYRRLYPSQSERRGTPE